MFKSIQIKNFQSLKNVQVDLAPFTVIVGATDSGKSAFFRALSTLVSNRRGSEFITHGERICSISAELDQGTLVLQRGSATKDNFYEIDENGEKRLFSKLSGTVPDEVSAFLRIPAKDPINFASQFDKPYLLDTKEYSSAESARILGALTNVNLLFEAARESNRRKGEASSKLKTRVADLKDVTNQLHGYDDLEPRLEAIKKAEVSAKSAEAYTAAREAVAGLIEAIDKDKQDIHDLQSVVCIEVPDISVLEKLMLAKNAVEELVNSIHNDEIHIAEMEDQIQAEEANIQRSEDLYTETLRKEGTCPVCGTQIQ